MLVPYVGLLIYLAVVGYFGWQMLGKGTTGKVGRKASILQSPIQVTWYREIYQGTDVSDFFACAMCCEKALRYP